LLEGKKVASGIWTAVSGAVAQSQTVETVANNLANANTLGFKKDQNTFKEYLAAQEREHTGVDIPRGPIKDRELYPLDGKDQSFVVVNGTYSNFKQGALQVTNQPLDLAIDGDGFFEVLTPEGVRYTRLGSFKRAPDGLLTTSQGYPVLSENLGGEQNLTPGAAAARFININDAQGMISVSSDGRLFANGQQLGRLSVVKFQNNSELRKIGNVLFENPNPSNTLVSYPPGVMVRQGMLETSNVNPVEEMTQLIRANRMFEQEMKVMKTYGELMGREANDIGKL
jgi:flagellar basal-body rod protein FlgG